MLGISAVARRLMGPGSLKGRLASGVFWSGMGQGIFRLLWFLAIVLTARVLGKEDFGRFAMVTSTVGVIGTLAGLGLSTSAVRFIALHREGDKEKAGSLLGFFMVTAVVSGAAGMAVVWGLAGPAASLLKAPGLETPIRLLTPTILFNPVFWVMVGVLSGLEEFRLQTVVWTIYGVLALPIVAGGVYIYGIAGGVAGLSVVSVLICVAALVTGLWACRKKGIRPGRFRWRESLTVLWSFSAPAYVSGLMRSLVEWGARAAVVQYPGGYAAVGGFEVARQIPRLLTAGVEVLMRPVLPVLSSMYGKSEYGEMSAAVRKVTLLLVVTGGPAAVVLVLMSRPLLSLYGGEFTEYGVVFALAAAGMFLLAVRQPAAEMLTAGGRMWAVAATDTLWGMVLVGTAWYLASEGWGAVGLAGALAAAAALHLGWTWLYARAVMRRLQRTG